MLTWKELEIICNGYEKRLCREKDIQRMLLAGYLNVNRRKGAPAVNIEKLVPFVTDGKHKPVQRITADEFEDLKRLLDKVVWQNRN